MRPVSILFLTTALAASAFAQFDASYSPYGAGCNGTGTGLGGNNVLPAPMATAFGGSDNSIPFTWSPVKYQQVFLGSDLPRAFTMAGISVRRDEGAIRAHNISVELEIQVGYTTRTPTSMSTTFAANFDSGAPVQVVPRGVVDFPDQPLTPPANPGDFYFTIPWPIHFAWTPVPGRNFLVQVTIHGNSFGNQIWGYPLDACGGDTARLFGAPASATTGRLEPHYGLVLGFRELTHTAVPVLSSPEKPQIDNDFPVHLTQARPSSFALLLFGISDTSWNGLPLPFDLRLIGAPGCSLLASGEDMQVVPTDAAGAGSFTYLIPNNIYLLRGRFYNQYLVRDPAANGLGFVVSNGGAGVIGNQ